MFDLKSLVILKGKQRDSRNYSFVGIQRNQSNKQLEFWLPLGFENFPSSGEPEYYRNVKKLFFGMYKNLKTYVNSRGNSITRELDHLRDGVVYSDEGFELESTEDESILVYSKIIMIDDILGSFDELTIMSVFEQRSRTEKIDYSRIDKYLHKAVYLEDNFIFVDEMNLPQKRLKYSSTDLVEMFCFIYCEIKTELEELDEIRSEVKFLSSSFKEKYLHSKSSLFDEFNFSYTVTILKETLNRIYLTSTYKDADFWRFYEAIESFLYSEAKFGSDSNGPLWGIQGFASLWEDMCQAYMFEFREGKECKIYYADSRRYSNQIIGGQRVFASTTLHDVPFYIEFEEPGPHNNRRFLRPDIVFEHLHDVDKAVDEEFDVIFNPQIESTEASTRATIYLHLGPSHHKDFFYKLVKEMNRKAPPGYVGQPKKTRVSFRDYPKGTYNNLVSQFKDKMRMSKLKGLNANLNMVIADCKYLSYLDFFNGESSTSGTKNKIDRDTRKQLFYEYALQQVLTGRKLENNFWVPCFFQETQDNKAIDMGEYIAKDLLKDVVAKADIKVFKVNFMELQKYYASSRN